MNDSLVISLVTILALMLLVALATKFIPWLKKRKPNTELWATIFAGITQNLVNLEPLKTPESVIVRKAKRDGQNKYPLKP